MSTNKLDVAQHLVNTQVYCVCPSRLLEAIQADDEFLNVMLVEDDNNEVDEPMSYWLVSGWLAEKLVKEGGRVYDLGDAFVWGRMASGQAISDDWIIQAIADR